MKPHVLIAFALAVGLLFSDSSMLLAQTVKEDKPKTEAATPIAPSAAAEKVTPLKVQVLLTEFDGSKKVKSLPYISYVTASADRANAYEFTKIRLGTGVHRERLGHAVHRCGNQHRLPRTTCGRWRLPANGGG